MNKTKLAAFCARKLDRGFILGMPGTGKSYSLFNEILPAWRKANPDGVIALLAFTNKAKNVLIEYAKEFGYTLNDQFAITTIHKFTGLVPTLDATALNTKHLQQTKKAGEVSEADLIVIDEVGTVDDTLAAALDDALLEGKYEQVLFLGDYEQLKPVNGEPAIQPAKGDWIERLTVIRRSDKPDMATAIEALSRKIAAADYAKRFRLTPSENIRYGKPTDAAVSVAWRNKTVQTLNAELQGYVTPRIGDAIYCDTRKEEYSVLDVIPVQDFEEHAWLKIRANAKTGEPDYLHAGNDQYRTLHRLYTQLVPRMDGYVCGLNVRNEDGDEFNIITLFGTGDYRSTIKQLMEDAVHYNKEVMADLELTIHPDDKKKNAPRIIDSTGKIWGGGRGEGGGLATYLKKHYSYGTPGYHERPDSVIERAAFWSAYMAMKELIFHTDFNHARTLHAMQGSSVDTVYVDVQDLAAADPDTYHRLLYVAISRARHGVFFS